MSVETIVGILIMAGFVGIVMLVNMLRGEDGDKRNDDYIYYDYGDSSNDSGNDSSCDD